MLLGAILDRKVRKNFSIGIFNFFTSLHFTVNIYNFKLCYARGTKTQTILLILNTISKKNNKVIILDVFKIFTGISLIFLSN